MELTDREIRNVGEGRYVRRWRWWTVLTGLVGIAWFLLYSGLLLPVDATVAENVRFLLLGVLPAGGAAVWPFVLCGKAGKRFLASVDRVDVTDREIRDVGFNRYIRQRIWRLVIVGLVLLGSLFLIRWLMPGDSTTAGWWVGVAALVIPPYGVFVWILWRAHRAGKRFLVQWKSEQVQQ
ncbi:hypothetical protein LCGC14_0925220 [marine sediment metagenome]|uniref:Uncharacterized protein n=1 Tax=marine sediment metagenome TaxID=412755 RepID=A0A0F9R8B1_9ZZZZ